MLLVLFGSVLPPSFGVLIHLIQVSTLWWSGPNGAPGSWRRLWTGSAPVQQDYSWLYMRWFDQTKWAQNLTGRSSPVWRSSRKLVGAELNRTSQRFTAKMLKLKSAEMGESWTTAKLLTLAEEETERDQKEGGDTTKHETKGRQQILEDKLFWMLEEILMHFKEDKYRKYVSNRPV